MDFVVVGLGVGALAILLGLTIREVGGRWWSLQPDVPLSSPEQARRLAIGRVSRAGGSVLSLAGGLILLATIVAIALGLPDRTGAIVVMAVVTVAVLGTVAWGAVYARRYHPRTARRPLRPRPAAEPLADQPPSLAGTIDAVFAGTTDDSASVSTVDDRQISDDSDDPSSGTLDAGSAPSAVDPASAGASQETPDTGDGFEVADAAGAPVAQEAPSETVQAGAPPATAGAPAHERPAPSASTAGRELPATGGVPTESGLLPGSSDRTPSQEPTRTPPPRNGLPSALAPAAVPDVDTPPNNARDADRALPGAPGESVAGIDHPGPTGDALAPPMANDAPPRRDHAGPSRRDRTT